MSQGDVEHENMPMMRSARGDFSRRILGRSSASGFSGSRFFLRSNKFRIAQRLDQRVAGPLLFKNSRLRLGQLVQKLPLRNVLFDLGFGLMHANHERDFAKTDGASVELRGEKKSNSRGQEPIMNGAFHTPWFYQDE